MALQRTLLIGLVCLAVASCTVPERTTAIDPTGPDPPHVTGLDDATSRKDTLFVVTASGGGTRAAALTLGALRALDGVKIPGGNRSLLDEVDVISSVSGGSVTAAYFALRGKAGFGTLENGFIRRDGISALIWRALNPVTLVKLPTDSYSRLDVLVDYLKDSLFGETTFAALQRRRPYLILNAADMSGGSVFSFTQPQFDLICADLSKMKLAEAVAASAAFPVALAPLAIRNYSPCDWQTARAREFTGSPDSRERQPRWPPIWIQNAVETDINVEGGRNRVRRGRAALSYLNLDCGTPFDAVKCHAGPVESQRQWIHLLDGGIADNLGLNEPVRLISTVDVDPRLLNRIFSGEIRNLVFVVVNARSESDSDLDRSGATPGIFKMLSATTGSAIDAASFGMLDRLDSIIRELLLLEAKAAMLQERIKALNIEVVPIDFDFIADPVCRRYFKNIATSWSLKPTEITALNDIAGALLRGSAQFGKIRAIYRAPTPNGPDMSGVCAALK